MMPTPWNPPSARGDIVIIDPTDIEITRKAIFAVRLEEYEGECAIKRVWDHKDHWVLVSDNPEYDPIAMEKPSTPISSSAG